MTGSWTRPCTAIPATALLVLISACSLRQMATNTLAEALADGRSVFASHDDPDLVRDALPFALATTESLIARSPRHAGLLTTACSGFTQYAYAFVQQEADVVEARDFDRATAMRERAKRLYLRGLGYGLRALDVRFPGTGARLREDPAAALAKTRADDVPLLYWTGAAWGAAFALDKTDSTLAVDQRVIEALMRRAIQLDEDWEQGLLHEFFIAWEGGRSSVGGSLDRAREHFDRALALSAGQRASPLVTYAEVVSVGTQNRKEFVDLLGDALAIDLSKTPPEQRLANIISQRRARWLLARADELFIE